MTLADLREAQDQDSIISVVKREMETGEVMPVGGDSDPMIATLKQQWSKLITKDKVLYRVVNTQNEKQSQLVLSKEYQLLVLRSLYDDNGHLGMQ